MNNGSVEEKIKDLETQMWEAFANGDSKKFSKLVSDDAMMICGGIRESGREYAKIVANVRLDSYEISEFFTKLVSNELVMTNYIVKVMCHDSSISGTFRVSSLWILSKNKWELVFNQDSKLS